MEASTTGCSRTTRPPGKGPESAADSGAAGGGAGAAGAVGAAAGGALPAGAGGAAVGLCGGAAAGGAALGAVAAILQEREAGFFVPTVIGWAERLSCSAAFLLARRASWGSLLANPERVMRGDVLIGRSAHRPWVNLTLVPTLPRPESFSIGLSHSPPACSPLSYWSATPSPPGAKAVYWLRRCRSALRKEAAGSRLVCGAAPCALLAGPSERPRAGGPGTAWLGAPWGRRRPGLPHGSQVVALETQLGGAAPRKVLQ